MDFLDYQTSATSGSLFDSGVRLLFPDQTSPLDVLNQQAITKLGTSSDSFNDSKRLGSRSAFNSGYFTVGSTGQVGIDYLFDGGGYEGQLGIFSLTGLEHLELGSQQFIQEVIRRVLSDSTLGHLVINDQTEAARFTDESGWEGNFNAGNYQGPKTFAMNAGDRFGVVLLPNGTFQQIAGQSDLYGNQQPLFSLTTANPNRAFQFGQIADVTGHGSTFVMEDLSLAGYSEKDYNDIVFQVQGAIGSAVPLEQVICPNKNWLGSALGQTLLSYVERVFVKVR